MPKKRETRLFSKRHGYARVAREITIREDAPENLRHFVLDLARELGLGPDDLRNEACGVLHVRADPHNWSPYPNVWGEVEDLIYDCDWYKVYDFMERLYDRLDEHQDVKFEQELNEFFMEQGIGWNMVDGEIVTRGTEAFEIAVHQASIAMETTERETARDEIREALADLSRRPTADLTGAIQHGMAALECVARDVCDDPGSTLGEIIKRYPNLVPKPLDTAVEKAWGYASEMGRHLREGREPERREVELIVGLASTISTYLIAKTQDFA